MPVGTAATVKAMLPSSVRSTGADILLGNTYHLMLRPTAERIASLGGLHKFMDWEYPILTDSGGFQVMSLSALKVIYQDSSHGPDHNKNFSSEVLLNDEVIGAGDGKSKKSAQQSAAKDALAKLDA